MQVALRLIAEGNASQGLMWLDVPYVFMGYCQTNTSLTYAQFCQKKVDARIAQVPPLRRRRSRLPCAASSFVN